MKPEAQEQLAAVILLDEMSKNPSVTAAELYERCLARGVDLRVNGRPLDGRPSPRPQPPEQTAYLCMEHRMGPGNVPVFRGFRIFSCEPWNLSGESSAMFHTLYYQVSAPDFHEAQQRLLDICRDFRPLQWIWPYVDPSHEAIQARLEAMLEVDRVCDAHQYRRK